MVVSAPLNHPISLVQSQINLVLHTLTIMRLLTDEKVFLEHLRVKNLIRPNSRVLIALSGGADSTALVHLLYAITPFLNLTLAAAHVNFNLRARASARDEAFCNALCETYSIPLFTASFQTQKISDERKTSLEETARNLRYDFFRSVMHDHHFSTLVTAHHKNDNAETILFNLFRGASLLGLRGIPEHRESILRPMLYLTREEILKYLAEKNQRVNGKLFCTDRTNFSDEPDRNFLRLRVIPLVEKRFKHKLLANLSRLSENAGELQEFLDAHVKKLLKRNGLTFKNHTFQIAALKKLTAFEQKELFKVALKQYAVEPDAKLLARLTTLLQTQSGRRVTVSAGLDVCWEKDMLRFVQHSSE
jgi:tRNA(Ile)-lysidine synthase